MSIKFTAPITPVTFKRPDTHHKRRYDPADYAAFKLQLGYYAKAAMAGRPAFIGPIKIHADFYKNNRGLLKKTFGDLDNFLKAVLDALNEICYLDDAQVTEISGRKFVGAPHIEIELEELS